MSIDQSEIESLRRFLENGRVDHGSWTDERLTGAISEAKEWIGRRRWSWKIVAANILIDGRPSARGLRDADPS